MSRKLAKRTKRRTAHKRNEWRDEVGMLRARLAGIVEIIEVVETRCMAVDGPVTPTLREMTEDELRRIYNIANAGRSKNRPVQSGNAVVVQDTSVVDPQGVILPRE